MKNDNEYMKNVYDLNISEFVKGFKKASDIIRSEKPDYIFAPVIGAVPFVDILKIVDRNFQLDNVTYLPNSSRFENREELMKTWYKNFYETNDTGNKMKIICLDEVLSGSSATAGYKQFEKSLENRARTKAKGFDDEFSAYEKFKIDLRKKIKYKMVGFSERGHTRNPAFNRLKNQKIIYTIDLDNIPTIDNVSLNPIRLKELKRRNGRAIYSPEIESFDITSEYMEFLRCIAQYVGVEPSNVSPVNLSRIELDLKKSIK